MSEVQNDPLKILKSTIEKDLSPVAEDSPVARLYNEKVIEREKKKKAFIDSSPVAEDSPVASLYQREEKKKKVIESSETNLDLPTARLYDESIIEQPANAPETLGGTLRESFWTRARRKTGKAVRNLINNWFNAHPETEIILSSQLPVAEKTVAPVVSPPAGPGRPPDGFFPEPFGSPEPFELGTRTETGDWLTDGENLLATAEAAIKTMEELEETETPLERMRAEKPGFEELRNKMLRITMGLFPRNSDTRRQAWETAWRFLSPANNVSLIEKTNRMEVAKRRRQMFQLERALIRSEFNGSMPIIIQQGLRMEELYGLWVTDPMDGAILARIKSEFNKRNGELVGVANAVLSPPNARNNLWHSVSVESKKYLQDMATVVSAIWS